MARLGKPVQALAVVCQHDEIPLCTDLLKSAQEELPEAHDRISSVSTASTMKCTMLSSGIQSRRSGGRSIAVSLSMFTN